MIIIDLTLLSSLTAFFLSARSSVVSPLGLYVLALSLRSFANKSSVICFCVKPLVARLSSGRSCRPVNFISLSYIKRFQLCHDFSCVMRACFCHADNKGTDQPAHMYSLIRGCQYFSLLEYEPYPEKICLRGFRLGLIQTELYSHRRWLET